MFGSGNTFIKVRLIMHFTQIMHEKQKNTVKKTFFVQHLEMYSTTADNGSRVTDHHLLTTLLQSVTLLPLTPCQLLYRTFKGAVRLKMKFNEVVSLKI